MSIVIDKDIFIDVLVSRLCRLRLPVVHLDPLLSTKAKARRLKETENGAGISRGRCFKVEMPHN